MIPRDIICAVRELLDLHLDTAQIAARMNLDYALVQACIDIINNIAT